MNDLNKPLILDTEHNPENNKNSNNLSNDEIQKKTFKLLSVPRQTQSIFELLSCNSK